MPGDEHPPLKVIDGETGQMSLPGLAKARSILDNLHPDEPYFVLRAKDILSLLLLQHYQSLLEAYAPYGEGVVSMQDCINQFREWQQINADKVRLPD